MEKGELESLARVRNDDELAVTLTLTVRLHQNGAMSVEGPTADKPFCKRLLDEAWNAINRQPSKGQLIIPGHDVDSKAKEAYG